MDLDTLIAMLQAHRAVHGNIKVHHYDCEYGITDASPGLCKVLKYREDDSRPTQFNCETIEAIRADHMRPFDEQPFIAHWDALPFMTRDGWGSRERYLDTMRQAHEQSQQFLKRYDAQPFAIVF